MKFISTYSFLEIPQWASILLFQRPDSYFYILPIQLLIHVYAIWSRFLLFSLSATNEYGSEGGHGEGSGGGYVYGERPIEVDGYGEGPGEGLDEEPGGEVGD